MARHTTAGPEATFRGRRIHHWIGGERAVLNHAERSQSVHVAGGPLPAAGPNTPLEHPPTCTCTCTCTCTTHPIPTESPPCALVSHARLGQHPSERPPSRRTDTAQSCATVAGSSSPVHDATTAHTHTACACIAHSRPKQKRMSRRKRKSTDLLVRPPSAASSSSSSAARSPAPASALERASW